MATSPLTDLRGSTGYKRQRYLLAKLNGQGCGVANSMSSAPKRAMFFRKLIMSACFICGSDTAQKLCMRKVVPSMKTISRMIPTVGQTPSRTLAPPSSSKTPVPATASLGNGMPFALAYPLMSFNFVKWLEALINQKAAKMTLPMRKAMFISFSFQEHWMKAGANRIRADLRGRFRTLEETWVLRGVH